jgi:hypothetical protein
MCNCVVRVDFRNMPELCCAENDDHVAQMSGEDCIAVGVFFCGR